MPTVTIKLREPHAKQQEIIDGLAKRTIIRAGRRGGKTTLAAYISVVGFLAGQRILYAAPTDDQIDRFWFEVKRALAEPLAAGLFYKNETKRIIELSGTEQRIRGKTAYNANMLRGDYADKLILDEYQLMSADAWGLVGAPMMLDTDGTAIFIYTNKRGKHHSKELYKRAKADRSGRWATFVFSSHDNPHLSAEALAEITQDMTRLAYRAEILAEDIEDDPRALWKREDIESGRVAQAPDLALIVVGVDPPGSEAGAECGIVVVGKGMDGEGYVIGDYSLRGSPAKWGLQAVTAYNQHKADRMVGEVNNGGDMVEHTIRTVEGGARVRFRQVRASRGKAIRAEPIAALYEQGHAHHLGAHGELEDQLCNWVPGEGSSPDRLDALVWGFAELKVKGQGSDRPLVLWGDF